MKHLRVRSLALVMGAVALMSNKAIKYIRNTKGWEIGVGPTVVVLDEGVAKNLTSSTLKDDAYAFVFDQQGRSGYVPLLCFSKGTPCLQSLYDTIESAFSALAVCSF